LLKLFKNKSTESDEQLVARIVESADMRAFEELCGRYMALSYGLCLKYLRNEHNAKDAVMQIFELLLEKLRQHKINVFRAWFYVVCRNHCLMQLRSDARRKNVVFDEKFMESADDFHLDSVMDDERQMQTLKNCIEMLPPHQREAIVQFFLEERSYREVSDATGNDLKKVKSFIQNGKRNLKICLKKNDYKRTY